jgi:hypothetical protein
MKKSNLSRNYDQIVKLSDVLKTLKTLTLTISQKTALSCMNGSIISNVLDLLFSFYLTPKIVQVFKISHPQQFYSFLSVFLLYKEVIYTYISYYTNI